MKYTFVVLSFFINIPTLYAASASSRQLTTSKKPITAKQIPLHLTTAGAPKNGAKPTAKKPTTQRKGFTPNKPTTTKKPDHKAATATANTVSGIMVVGKAMSTTTKSLTTTPDDGDDFQAYKDDAGLLMSQEELKSCGYWQAPLHYSEPIKLRIKTTTQSEPSTNAFDLSGYEETPTSDDDDGELAFTAEQLEGTCKIPAFKDPNPLILNIGSLPTDPKNKPKELDYTDDASTDIIVYDATGFCDSSTDSEANDELTATIEELENCGIEQAPLNFESKPRVI